MNFLQRNSGIIATLAIVLAIGVAIFGVQTKTIYQTVSHLGGVTNYDELDTTALKVGSSGSRVGPVIAGQATFAGMDVSQNASTSKPYDLAITGIVSGDTFFAQFSTSTVNSNNLINSGWVIRSCHASTTSGFGTCDVLNLTGANNIPSVNAVGSSTNYLVLHPLTSVPGL